MALDLDSSGGPRFEYRTFWAEESGALGSNQGEWSWGNGGTGAKGLPVGTGWMITEMSLHLDTITPNTLIQVDLVDWRDTAVADAVVIASLFLDQTVDGFAANNAAKLQLFNPFPPVPDDAIVGFLTRTVTGSANDGIASCTMRRIAIN